MLPICKYMIILTCNSVFIGLLLQHRQYNSVAIHQNSSGIKSLSRAVEKTQQLCQDRPDLTLHYGALQPQWFLSDLG